MAQAYDVVIKGGQILSDGKKTSADIAVKDGVIVKIGTVQESGVKEMDATGCLVTPGLVDLHIHIYPHGNIGVPADLFCIPNGITSATDGGSLGWGNYEQQRFYASLCKLRLKYFINVSGAGFSVNGMPDQMNLNLMNGKGKAAIRRLFSRFPSELAGLKIRLSAFSMKDMGEEPLLAAIDMANELGVRLMAHISDTTIRMDRVASLMRKGDILTHCFNDKGMTILDESGKVYPQVIEAQKRGVVFDVGNARMHFGFSTGVKAIEQGFLPNTISTDSTMFGAYKKPVMFSLPMVMSKFVAMGMSVEDVFACCTNNAAAAVDFGQDVGYLNEGGIADIAVFKLLEKDFTFEDYKGVKVPGKLLIKPVATVKDGDFYYRDIEY